MSNLQPLYRPATSAGCATCIRRRRRPTAGNARAILTTIGTTSVTPPMLCYHRFDLIDSTYASRAHGRSDASLARGL